AAVDGLAADPPPLAPYDGERGRDGDRPPGDRPVGIEAVTGGDQLVECAQRGNLRDRNEVAAPEAPDLTFYAAFFMRPHDARAAEERVEPVVAAQRGEPFRFSAVAALKDPHDCRFEVVVPDPSGHTPEIFEGQHMALQESFLRLGGESDVKGFARVG